jgi:hypothetical protein
MSFTNQSTAYLKAAFDRASAMQPAGAPRIGELETNVLTGMVEELAGADDKNLWLDELDYVFTICAPHNNTVTRWVNGRRFEIEADARDVNEDKDTTEECWFWFVKVKCDAGSLESAMNCDHDDDQLKKLLASALDAMEAFTLCGVCGDLLEPSKVFCGECLEHWNDKGCSVCGKRMGKLTDGVHEPCAKKQRTN